MSEVVKKPLKITETVRYTYDNRADASDYPKDG